MRELRYLEPQVFWGFLLFLFVFGSCIFSFFNVVIYRVPRKLGFVKGRSYCPSCGAQLHFDDLIPIVSWIVLRGRCRYCKAPIPLRDTVMEVLGGILACLCFLRYGVSLRGVIAFLFLAIGIAISLVDLDTLEIPDGFLIALLALSLLSVPVFSEITLSQRAVGFFVISVPMLLLTLKIPGAFGGGDIKYTAVAGLFLGWQNSLLAAFLAIVSGGIYGGFLLLLKKSGRKDRFAFGPFLCGGMAIALLWGDLFFRWYISVTGL